MTWFLVGVIAANIVFSVLLTGVVLDMIQTNERPLTVLLEEL